MKPLPKEKIDRLEYYLKGDRVALLFCLDLLYVAHLWDDLIDGDKERSIEDINQGFIKSLASIPSNQFFELCRPALMPMMYNALIMWLEANKLKDGGPEDRLVSYCLDNAVIEIIHFCILAKGGPDWAREVSGEFWSIFGPDHQDFLERMELDHV